MPDLIIHHGADPIPEYNNPKLIPGMFPTLYPFGIGGFEDHDRPTALSFEKQAEYYLNVPEKMFRYHYSFIFIVLNMIQRCRAHLHTHFTVNSSRFETVAHSLTSLSADTISDVAEVIEAEHSTKSLNSEQRQAMDLLHYVNTIAEKIPGSYAAKISAHSDIRNYFSYFSLLHLFFTFNPSPVHSPIFQVMHGDNTVDLASRYPKVPLPAERVRRLAHDPVAAADFFEFAVKPLFEHLLGWDYKRRQSTTSGGLFGRLRAFYGLTECTEHGGLHGHFVLFLEGASNPSEIHDRLWNSEDYQHRFFDFFEGIIHHHFPDVELEVEKSYNPRVERPPVPPNPSDKDIVD
ncbi:hypothetical protein FA15DRAFT_596699 [Coprinopsis marcescibilis]|uniref:Helitron helicase-like domain-containing protein n=1 Tax=Coprinopsis marcescibilis TaxID=230819 RepID=A0A5C3KP82_COPMA|nr:hypothetical protein FA15DRAFT_596699 [Coprinopsis marcescibilis]